MTRLSWRWRVLLWMERRGWNLARPRIHMFWYWVVMPNGVGFWNWLRWATRS